MLTSPASPGVVTPAGFLVRTRAYLVDALLLSLIGGAFPYLVLVPPVAGQNGQSSTAIGTASVLISFVYFVLFWSYVGGGRTLGMRLFGLKVVTEDGGAVSVPQAIVRWIGLWISFLVWFIGVLWVIRDPQKQGWHDKLARTRVVHV
jgi:uncharacterized RDD family membrane protein YckC